MHKVRDKLRSVDWRDVIMNVAGLSNLVLIGAMVYFLVPLSGEEITLIALVSAGYTLFLWRLRPLVRRVRRPGRVKYTVNMSLSQIVDEFVYIGFRVEAMTESTAVFMRINMSILRGNVLLIAALFWIPFGIYIASENPADELALLAFLIPAFSFVLVFTFTIAGFGYDRVVVHQVAPGGPSSCLVSKRSVLPSRVYEAKTSTEDHGDEAWYRDHPHYI